MIHAHGPVSRIGKKRGNVCQSYEGLENGLFAKVVVRKGGEKHFLIGCVVLIL